MGALVDKSRISELHPRRFFLESWRAIDREAAIARADREARGLGYDYRPLIALASGAVSLTLMFYFGGSRTFFQLVDVFAPGLRLSPFLDLYRYAFWAFARDAGMLLLPLLTIKLTRQSVRDQGLAWEGVREHIWIYFLLYAFVLVLIVGISFTREFSTYYPFYHDAHRSWFELGVWEILYASQFFSLEFFFRGYWLRACRDSLGSAAIFAMIVPYCMVHFGKPVAETLAAIVAGVVLGTLAMKTRSIWCGFFIHVSVAISMDVAAILQTSALPHVWFPHL